MTSMSKGLAAVLLIACAVSLPTGAFASRPLTTDDVFTVDRGHIQLETGVDFIRQSNHDREVVPTETVTYGVHERVDLAVGSAYLFVDPVGGGDRNGVGDTTIVLKYHVIDQKGLIPHFTPSAVLKIPTASRSKGLGTGKTDFGFNGILTWIAGKQWQIYSNIGFIFSGDHSVGNPFNYSVAAQFSLSDKLALVGEIVGVNNFNGHTSDDPLFGLVGVRWQITESLMLDAAAQFGMNKAAPDYRFTTGFTFVFQP